MCAISSEQGGNMDKITPSPRRQTDYRFGATLSPPASSRCQLVEIGLDARRDRRQHLVPPGIVLEVFDVERVAHEPQLDQERGNLRRLQHEKVRLPYRKP